MWRVVLNELEFIWENANGGGNPYHDDKGRFTYAPTSFTSKSGGAEVTDNPKDWYLTEGLKTKINKVQNDIKTARDCIEYLKSKGVKAEVEYEDLISKHEDWDTIEFDAMKRQAQAIAASYEVCETLFGKQSLSALKEVSFYGDNFGSTGSFAVNLKGEKDPQAGRMELSTNINARQVLHEFIHVVQASNAKGNHDAVTWSDMMLKRLHYEGKAYTGAKKDHMAAEIMADEVSYGISQGGEKRLGLVASLANFLKESNKNRLNLLLNAWDEKKHPRDSKGRFTFVLSIKDNYSSSAIGGTVISKETISEARKALTVFAGKSVENLAQYTKEKEDIGYYQGFGYKAINDELRSGSSIEDTMCEALNDACRFSSKEPLTVMRGESSFNNNWEKVQAGQKMPEGLHKAFISTSTDANVAEGFASKKRDADPNGNSKIYETVVTINVPTSQRFGIPNAYDTTIAANESEIILPYGTNGLIKSFKEKEVKIGNRTVVQQFVTIDIL